MRKIVEITLDESVLKKNDIVLFPNKQRLIVLDVDGSEVTLYPFPIRAHWIIAVAYFYYIKIRYLFKKLWKWIRGAQ